MDRTTKDMIGIEYAFYAMIAASVAAILALAVVFVRKS